MTAVPPTASWDCHVDSPEGEDISEPIIPSTDRPPSAGQGNIPLLLDPHIRRSIARQEVVSTAGRPSMRDVPGPRPPDERPRRHAPRDADRGGRRQERRRRHPRATGLSSAPVCPESRPAVRPRASSTLGLVFKPTGRKAAGSCRCAARGCPRPVAGRSLRPSWAPLTRCCLRSGIHACAGQQRRLPGHGHPLASSLHHFIASP